MSVSIREKLRCRKAAHQRANDEELARLVAEVQALGVQQLVLFGSAARKEVGLFSDLDLLVVWDTPLNFLDRTVALYRRLQPQVSVDLLVYTSEEMTHMAQKPFIKQALAEGRVLYEA